MFTPIGSHVNKNFKIFFKNCEIPSFRDTGNVFEVTYLKCHILKSLYFQRIHAFCKVWLKLDNWGSSSLLKILTLEIFAKRTE